MRYDPVDPSLFVRNRERLFAKLPTDALVVVHANDVMPTNADGVMPFRQNNDLYWLTGVDQEETVVVLCPGAKEEKDREILFVRETSDLIAVWEGAKLTKEQATEVSGIQSVAWTSAFEATLQRLAPQAASIYLTSNEHLRAEAVVETRNARFVKRCQDLFPLHQFCRLAPLMHELRAVKDEVEISQLKQAVDITEAGFRRVLDFMKPGVGEWEVEAEYLHEFLCRRSRGFAYQPIIGSGKNACVLHYIENSQRCADGDLVLMDVGAEWANWNADMTRTVPVNGRFTKRQKDVYNATLRVMRFANSILKPGLDPLEYQRAVQDEMGKELVDLGLLTPADIREQSDQREAVRRYFMHGTSHHLGLDVHDVAPAGAAFQENCVLTIEPGIYIPEEGIGVRIENNIVVRESGNIDLFDNFPIEVDEIEEAMNA